MYEKFTDLISEELTYYLDSLSLIAGRPLPELLSLYPMIVDGSFLTSGQTAKGRILVKIGEMTEEDTIAVTIAEDFYKREEPDAMYSLVDNIEITRPETNPLIDDDVFEFFITKLKEVAATYIHNSLKE